MTKGFSEADQWVAYLGGELDEAQETALWQSLIDSGAAWNRGAKYSRKAIGLILSNRCHQPGRQGAAKIGF